MNLCVVIPNYDYLNQAGARIRYSRIQDALCQNGVNLSFKTIDELGQSSSFSSDVYLISKTYDTRVILLSHEIKQAGKSVGVDLFDDYFSQLNDSRFTRLRRWLTQLSDISDFAMCSTPRMKQAISSYFKDKPIHVLNDPFESFDENKVTELVASKWEKLKSTKQLELAWFGMGDNPYFTVGLQDLVRFGRGAIKGLLNHGYEIKLSILTNLRALDSDLLAEINSLPCKTDIELWSEEKEEALLRSAHFSIIPVNTQSFSVVKSLNRVVTALKHGTNVLSLGYDLYAPFSNWLYRDTNSILQALDEGELLVNEHTIGKLKSDLKSFSCPETEAKNLQLFLENTIVSSSVVENNNLYKNVVVFGQQFSGDTYRLSKKFKWLTVGSPFASSKLNYDIWLKIDKKGNLAVFVSSKIIGELDRKMVAGAEHSNTLKGYLKLCNEEKLNFLSKVYDFNIMGNPFLQISHYPELIGKTIEVANTLLPEGKIVTTEERKQVWWME